jgi:hypothetical protein
MKLRFLAVLTLAALASCGSPNDPGVGGVTKAEAEQLNEAAEELNQDKPPPSVTQDLAPPVPVPKPQRSAN